MSGPQPGAGDAPLAPAAWDGPTQPPDGFVLGGDLPRGWRRCAQLGCAAAPAHDGGHVPEPVPPAPDDTGRAGLAALAGSELDIAAELRAVGTVVDQPPPAPSDGPPVWELVIADAMRMVADMRERDRVGRARYGTPLRPWNGRDALVDAYQEQLDGAVYLRQAIEEQRELRAAVTAFLLAEDAHRACAGVLNAQARDAALKRLRVASSRFR